MRTLNVELCFKMIDRETAKYKKFKKEGKQNLANHALHSKGAMERMLAAMMLQPVEKLPEVRKIHDIKEGRRK